MITILNQIHSCNFQLLKLLLYKILYNTHKFKSNQKHVWTDSKLYHQSIFFNHYNLFQLSQSTCMLQLKFQSLQSFSIITIFFDYHNLLVCYNWIFNHYNLFQLSQFACMINANLTWLFTCDFYYSWTTINDVIGVLYKEFQFKKSSPADLILRPALYR